MMKESKDKYYGVAMNTFLRESPQKFWRHLAPNKKAVTEICTQEGSVENKYDIADAFNDFFACVFTNHNRKQSKFEVHQQLPVVEELKLTYEGVLNLLLNLNTKKSAGPDEIINF